MTTQGGPVTSQTPIRDLDLTIYTYNMLDRNLIHTVGEVLEQSSLVDLALSGLLRSGLELMTQMRACGVAEDLVRSWASGRPRAEFGWNTPGVYGEWYVLFTEAAVDEVADALRAIYRTTGRAELLPPPDDWDDWDDWAREVVTAGLDSARRARQPKYRSLDSLLLRPRYSDVAPNWTMICGSKEVFRVTHHDLADSLSARLARSVYRSFARARLQVISEHRSGATVGFLGIHEDDDARVNIQGALPRLDVDRLPVPEIFRPLVDVSTLDPGSLLNVLGVPTLDYHNATEEFQEEDVLLAFAVSDPHDPGAQPADAPEPLG